MKKIHARLFRVLANLWPPLLFAGIKATHISSDYRNVEVVLKLRWYNRNYVGVHFGGSLYSMTDPWYMLMLLHNLGNEYFVWDKQADIDYIAPGKSHVTAHFQLTENQLGEIREKTAKGEKYLPTFAVEIRDKHNNIVARVKRTVYIKRKPGAR